MSLFAGNTIQLLNSRMTLFVVGPDFTTLAEVLRILNVLNRLYQKGEHIFGYDLGVAVGDWISTIVFGESGKCRLLIHTVGKQVNERKMRVDTTWCPGSENRAEPDKVR